MPYYEHIFIARQDISSQHVADMAQQFAEIIEKGGGKVTKTETWGLRTLAYRIRKNRKGHYVLMNLDTPHEAVQELERQERLNDDILRYMTVRVDELEDGPSAMMRAKSSRDGRGHRGDRGGPRPRDRAEAPKAEAAPAAPAASEEAKDKAADTPPAAKSGDET